MKDMFQFNPGRPFIIILVFAGIFSISGTRPINAYAASPGPPPPSAKFDPVEMPPMPGQAPGRAEETSQGPESVPPDVKKMDELIRRETGILRQGFEPSAPRPGREIQPAGGAEVIENQVQNPSGPGDSALPGREPAEKRAGAPRSSPTAARPGVPEVSGGPPPGSLSAVPAKPQPAAPEGKSPTPAPRRKIEPGPVQPKTTGRTPPDTEKTVAGDPVGDSIAFIFLKRLILYLVIGVACFLLVRKFVFKN
ncbi:MAG: hypothetical protein Q8P24_08075 [Desulfobacterales bacterium]|nr:hypothetical protein [Desulfobacterales bacterium]